MAEQTDAEKQEAFEKQQAEAGIAIYLPRGPVESTKPAEQKKKSADK